MIDVRGLGARAGGASVVRGVSFALAPGERVALVGASGSGKSLTGRALLALPPVGVRYTGAVRFEGRDLLAMADRDVAALRGAALSMVFQEPATALNPVKRIGAQVDESIRLHTDRPAPERARMVLDLFARTGLTDAGVGPERYPHELSGGQRQRVALAIAVALSPRLVVADEPTSALDAVTSARVLDLLDRLTAERGTALLLITHDLAVARRADRVIVMAGGTIEEDGAGVLTAPRSEAGRALVAGRRIALPARPAPPPRAPALEVEAVTVLRGGRRPVDGAGFAVMPGERVAIVGGSGSGKTTLLRALLGLVPATGRLTLAGSSMPLGSAAVRRVAQMVFQDPATSFNPRHSVERIVTEPLHGCGLGTAARRQRAADALERVELPAALLMRKPHALSGGQRQRIAIARALVSQPRILLADEPVSALDAALRGQIVALFDRLAREDHLALVLVAHDLALVAAIADRIVVMDDGRVVEEGTAEAIFNRPQHPATRALVEEANDGP